MLESLDQLTSVLRDICEIFFHTIQNSEAEKKQNSEKNYQMMNAINRDLVVEKQIR